MKEFMYDIDSVLIVAVLFVSMLLAIEAGYRIGRRIKWTSGEDRDAFKAHINMIAASMLGILALLLGFTFSLSLQRFDSRSVAVVDEANAIGTAYLRAQMLPAAVRGEVQQSLRDYLGLRVQASALTLVDRDAQQALAEKTTRAQSALWRLALQAAEEDPNPVKTGLFVQSLNELIDNFGRRDAALNRHVPEVVLLLLYATFLMAVAIVGYASGVAGHRASFASHVMVVLIVVLVFVILDLDRPRRGQIQVSQSSLVELQAAIKAGPNAGAQPSMPLGMPRSAAAASR
jgi:hypothetical protein